MRAKRLVWGEELGEHFAITARSLFKVYRAHDSFRAQESVPGRAWFIGGKFDTIDDAKDACQQEFDRIWREMTEEAT